MGEGVLGGVLCSTMHFVRDCLLIPIQISIMLINVPSNTVLKCFFWGAWHGNQNQAKNLQLALVGFHVLLNIILKTAKYH